MSLRSLTIRECQRIDWNIRPKTTRFLCSIWYWFQCSAKLIFIFTWKGEQQQLISSLVAFLSFDSLCGDGYLHSIPPNSNSHHQMWCRFSDRWTILHFIIQNTFICYFSALCCFLSALISFVFIRLTNFYIGFTTQRLIWPFEKFNVPLANIIHWHILIHAQKPK